MKKINLLLGLVILLHFVSNSQTIYSHFNNNNPKNKMMDVIFAPVTSYGVCTSYEFIFWKEKPITQYNTFNFWGGGGIIVPVWFLPLPALGIEGAFELRQYFKPNLYKKLNIDLYTGLAYMYAPIFGHGIFYSNFFGFVPGLKISYKLEKTKLIIDPYISISRPMYSDINYLLRMAENFEDWIEYVDKGIILTFGVRFSLNKKKKV
jgi:hypothetical protein